MSNIYPVDRRPDVGVTSGDHRYDRPGDAEGGFEDRVNSLIDQRLRDPLTYPTEMRAWLPMWVATEMQLPVTNVYGLAVLDNYSDTSSADLTLSTSYQAIPGLSITLRQTGVYLIVTTVYVEFTVAGGVAAVAGPLLDGAELAFGSYVILGQASLVATGSRSDITTVSSLSGGGIITATALKYNPAGTVVLPAYRTKVDAVRIGGVGAT